MSSISGRDDPPPLSDFETVTGFKKQLGLLESQPNNAVKRATAERLKRFGTSGKKVLEQLEEPRPIRLEGAYPTDIPQVLTWVEKFAEQFTEGIARLPSNIRQILFTIKNVLTPYVDDGEGVVPDQDYKTLAGVIEWATDFEDHIDERPGRVPRLWAAFHPRLETFLRALNKSLSNSRENEREIRRHVDVLTKTNVESKEQIIILQKEVHINSTKAAELVLQLAALYKTHNEAEDQLKNYRSRNNQLQIEKTELKNKLDELKTKQQQQDEESEEREEQARRDQQDTLRLLQIQYEFGDPYETTGSQQPIGIIDPNTPKQA
jgi:hypothetical protein